ncbi:phosphotransferase [Paenibacillus sp. KQZ6P-2]|uniref:Phosphotransferase n=1 Tax=Paenibacillus mangrovi TaxID=2931978 RepID=A0A9X2B1C5_9BACL|nr:phosphotransferase [Paenibacillus mangrovi]MCJ8010755.1 phosphotransferase [Paenibacillus mangrovi]
MNNQYNLQFEKLSNILKLGEIVETPKEISGGLLHRMFEIETSKGKIAIKVLNPQIMARPTALHNFIRSERIANIAANSLPAKPAKTIDGKSIHNIDNHFYLIFDWIDGNSLKSHEVNIGHCKKIGSILADIHKTDFSQIENRNNYDNFDNTGVTDWNSYLTKGEEINSVWVNLLQENIKQLFVWSDKAKKSSRMLAAEQVISHGDLEPKNVMWFQENPVIIDWESAGYINPMHDLVETAIYWSVNESRSNDKERFLAFISGYQKRFGILQADWRMVLEHGYLGKLDWLEYSLKRSLWIECTDEKEQRRGTLQVADTINALIQYEEMVSEIENWLKNDINKDFN